MPGQGRISGLALAELAGGFVLFWSGFKNQSVTSVLKEGLAGNLAGLEATGAATSTGTPSVGVDTTSASSGAAAAGGAPAAGSASGLAGAMQSVIGHCYLYGGAPGKNGAGCWDCSSCVSWVLGVKLGQAVPGGAYDGSTHGPTTLSYLAWTGAATVGHSAADAQAGDLVVWQTHMGVATGGGGMVSALNPKLGTLETTIAEAAPPGELLYVRRLK